MSDLRDLRRLESQFFRAPSAHNAQPWLLDYGQERVELRFDPARALPVGDPTRRDLYLSLGAFVEAVLISSAGARVAVEFVAALDDERSSVGFFVAAEAPYATPFAPEDLTRRQTSRLAYTPGTIEAGDLRSAREQLSGEAELHELAASELVDLYVSADRHLYDSPAVVAELRSWLRLSRRDPRYAKDGLSFECLALGAAEARALGLLLRPGVYPVVRLLRLHRAFTAATKSLLEKEGSVLVLSGPVRSPADRLAHGRSLLRAWLALARGGLYTHPLSQILDCPATERELEGACRSRPREACSSVFRVGRSDPPSRSARLVQAG